MGPRVGLYGRRISSPPGFDPGAFSPYSIAILTELPGPHFVGLLLLIDVMESTSRVCELHFVCVLNTHSYADVLSVYVNIRHLTAFSKFRHVSILSYAVPAFLRLHVCTVHQ